MKNRRHRVLYWFGPPCGVIPYSSVVVDCLTRAEDELVQWTNSLRRRGVLELDELVGVRMEWIRSKMRSYEIISDASYGGG